jgi:hypothetical protein
MKEEFAKFTAEERLSQIKILMNQLFRKHKETVRRGVRFYVPMKALISRAKITQEDMQF